ncbi:hypothetical protein B0T37_10685 [Chromobacterium violaceum]|nr:hypothetical protein B0T38_11080 [Chromobacterium violaceum]OQS26519.1 hypothetical protein B0T37_10685 [Chromobacterium violaceum]
MILPGLAPGFFLEFAMHTFTVEFVPRAKTKGPALIIAGVQASDKNAAIIRAASQERINAANYKPRATLQRKEAA